MDKKILIYQKLAERFDTYGYKLYLVGGTVRDYLLGKELTDMDAVTDAKPDDVLAFLNNVDDTFARLGSLKYKDPTGVKFDITTLRKESGYVDSRHPNKVVYDKNLEEDYPRRDFTVNAMYMDKDLKIYDFVGGQEDLKNHILRMVGDPDQRLKEDPLRILRAIRFHLLFNLEFEKSLEEAMVDRFYLLEKITDAKIRSELDKIKSPDVDLKEKKAVFKQFDIANLKGVIK